MAENFDAQGKAFEILNIAKTYLDHAPGEHPIENSAVRDIAGDAMRAELKELALSPTKLEAVGKALEDVGHNFFTVLPDAEMSADHGRMTELKFYPSLFDFSAEWHADPYVVKIDAPSQ